MTLKSVAEQTKETAQIFQFVRHHDVPGMLACGWIAHKSLDGSHHGRWAALMEWPHKDRPPEYPAEEIPCA